MMNLWICDWPKWNQRHNLLSP